MKVTRSINDKGEQVITVILPIPASVEPAEYDRLAGIFERHLSRALVGVARRSPNDWLNLETK